MEKKSDMMNTRLKVENENGIRGGGNQKSGLLPRLKITVIDKWSK
jgi:hypothetical protein